MNRAQQLTRIFIAFWVIYFACFWLRAFYLDDLGNLVAGHVNLWGDWAAHFTMGTHLHNNHFQLLESPFLIGARFAYPFAANLLSAGLLQLGWPLILAFSGPSFLFSCLTVWALIFFYRTVFKSPVIAILATSIFLLNGGLGFIYFAQDILAAPQPLTVLINPPHEYTRLDEADIKWISVIDSMMIPQRAFNHGFPLTLIALALVFRELITKRMSSAAKGGSLSLKLIISAGIILGVMPLIHTHSFLAAAIILTSWSGGVGLVALTSKHRTKSLRQLWPWVLLAFISGILATILFMIFFLDQTQGFFQWYPGWLAREYETNWLVFWLKNWGVVPVLALIGAGGYWQTNHWSHFKPKLTRLQMRLFSASLILPFLILFILLNLFLFQPFTWDNTKLLVWVSVGFSGFSAHALYSGWLKASQHKNLTLAIAKKLVLTLLFLVAIASGAIDAYRIQRIDLHNYIMYSREELELAEWVKANTPTTAVWLTGDQHNHWLFNLTGRQSLLTYRGWLWTHGYDYKEVERDALILFANPQAQPFFDKYDVNYVIIGPNEERVWYADQGQYRALWPVIHQTQNYTIYQISKLPN